MRERLQAAVAGSGNEHMIVRLEEGQRRRDQRHVKSSISK